MLAHVLARVPMRRRRLAHLGFCLLTALGSTGAAFCQQQPRVYPNSSAQLRNLVEKLGDRFGPEGVALKEAMTSTPPEAIAVVATNVGSHGATPMEGGTRVLWVDAAWANNPELVMMVLIHEQAHASANHPPLTSVDSPQDWCNEAEALCAQMGAISSYAAWATSQTPPKKKLKCTTLGHAVDSYRHTWERCHETYYNGDDCLACPPLCESDICDD